MTDREYFEALRKRARDIIGDMDRGLAGHELENGDGCFAPHVAKERLLEVARLGEVLSNLRYAVET